MLDHRAEAPFVGRQSELEWMRSAWDSSRTHRAGTIVLTGEAGTGKSSLVRAFIDSLPSGHTVLQGSCVPQDAGTLPYGPFVATVRRLRRTLGTEELRSAIGTDLASRLDAVVPSAGVTDTALPADQARGQLFETYLAMLEALADQGPVVVVLEDLHWIDAPSRDLLRFLLSSFDAPGVLLVLTQRPSDSPGQSGPLSDLAHFPGVSHLDVGGLDDDELRAHLQSLLGIEPAQDLLESVAARTSGVPLYVEALVGPDLTVLTGLPGSLRDLLLRSFNLLPPASRDVVKAACLAGQRVSHRLLAAVTHLPAAELEESLRPAIEARILLVDEVSYYFRHDLIAEAVREHLLPGERMGIHRRYAEAIAGGAATDVEDEDAEAPVVHRHTRVARHWRSAFDHEKALLAALEAARVAARAGRPNEELDMLELALQSWDRVPEAETTTGTTRIELLEAAAKASCWAARPERGTLLAAAALELLDPIQEADRSAAMLLESASCKHLLLQSEAWGDLESALGLKISDPSMLIEVSGMLARTAVEEGDHLRAQTALTVMTGAMNSFDAPHIAQLDHALTSLRVRLTDEEVELVLPELRACFEGVRHEGHRELEAMAALTLVRALVCSGHTTDAIAVAREALTRASSGGVQHFHGTRLVFEAAHALTVAGRWDDAIEVIDRGARSENAPHHLAHLRAGYGEIALRRGDLELADLHLEQLIDLLSKGAGSSRLRTTTLRLRLERAHAGGDFTQVVDLVGDLVAQPTPAQALWPALASAAGALAAPSSSQSSGRAEALQAVAELLESLPALGAVDRAYRDSIMLNLNVARPDPSEEAWLALADRWLEFGRPHDRGTALLRAAQVVARDDRRRARALLDRATDVASQFGATSLLRQCDALGRRIGSEGRATDPGAGTHTFASLRLTEREIEVFRLVALGMSNDEIARELFISRKTASVHVSNILGKLQVANRGAAAAFAHRHQLFDLS